MSSVQYQDNLNYKAELQSQKAGVEGNMANSHEAAK